MQNCVCLPLGPYQGQPSHTWEEQALAGAQQLQQESGPRQVAGGRLSPRSQLRRTKWDTHIVNNWHINNIHNTFQTVLYILHISGKFIGKISIQDVLKLPHCLAVIRTNGSTVWSFNCVATFTISPKKDVVRFTFTKSYEESKSTDNRS